MTKAERQEILDERAAQVREDARLEKPNLQAAATELGNMMRVFRVFAEAHNAMAVLANYDQVERESKQAAEAARAELNEAVIALEKAKADAADMREAAKSTLASAKAKAATLLTEAEDKANATLAEAQGKVNELIEQAGALTDRLNGLRNSVTEEEGRLESIRQKAAAAKEAARKTFEEI